MSKKKQKLYEMNKKNCFHVMATIYTLHINT